MPHTEGNQSQLGSLAESLVNIAIGIIIGFLSNIIFGYNVSIKDGLMISFVFTFISLVRSYIIRRVFNKYNFFKKG
jgi:hypothetical protein